MRVRVLPVHLYVCAVPQHALNHRGDLGGRTGLQLRANADRFPLDVPVDHHAGAPVALMPLGHEVGGPCAELAAVGGARGAGTPPHLVPDGEGGVHQLPQGRAHVGPVDEQVPHPPQRRLRLAVLAGHRDSLDPHVRAQPKQDQQQSAPQHILRQHLSGGHRGELRDEVPFELGVLQDVQQVDGAPAPLDLALERHQALRLLLLAARGDSDPRLTVLPDDRSPARRALRQRLLEAVQRRAELALAGQR